MIRFKYSITLLFCMLVFLANAQSNIDFVNPMVGTMSMGHTFPDACAPFGLLQLSPDTEMIPHNIDGFISPMLIVIAPEINTTITGGVPVVLSANSINTKKQC